VPPLTYDIAFERVQALAATVAAAEPHRNEATTRLQLIDTLFFDCLGWSRDLALLEDHENGEYADYVLDSQARRLIVEAKREGLWFELPTGLARISKLDALYALGGSVARALEQVATYAQQRGTPYAAISNGAQLIAFVASRSDGVAPRTGRALVFDSAEALVDGFADLWESLTPTACASLTLTSKLRGTRTAPPPKLSEQVLDYPGTAKSDDRHLMLSTLSALFLPSYTRDDEHEEQFLRECYCEPGAYSRLATLNRGVLRARYSTALGEDIGLGLEDAKAKEGLNPRLLEEVAVTTAGREPIVLLGNVGVGKTMFLRRLLRVDAKELAEKAVVLYIDLGRSAVLEDLRSYVASSFKDQLYEHYGIDIDAADFLRGTYHVEVVRFARGVNADLKVTDPHEFKKREIDHLLELSSHPENHLRRSLEHLVKLRSQQVIVVLDNIDQRNGDDQEQVFLIAETIARNWPCTVFVTLRPETFNASRVSGTLSGYQPQAFTIQPPRVERIVARRLQYGAKLYREHGRLPQWMGWTARSEDLRTYLTVLLKSFTRNERLRSALVNLSGGNARRALDLMTDYVSSPHADADSIVNRNRDGYEYLVPHHVFLRAVLLGDALHYHPRRSRIPNLFDTSMNDVREHFLLPSMLGMLRRAAEQQDSEGFLPIQDVFTTFQDAGFEPEQVEFALRRALDGDLAEQLPPDGEARAVRLTTAGAYAHQQLASAFQYLDAVVIDTPVGDAQVRAKLGIVHAVRPRLERARHFIDYLDEAWVTADCASTGLFDWPTCASALRAEIQEIENRL